MTKADVLVLLDFNEWARGRMMGAVAALTPGQFTTPLGSSFPSVHETVVHIYSAEWVWYMRCQGVSPTVPVSAADIPDLARLDIAWLDLAAKWRAYLDAMAADDVAREIDYRQMNGQASRSPLWQIVQHVVNHSSYHRGQVTTLLRQLGAGVVGTDLIAFHRERRIPV